jgi:D-glycero-D-manno-heptose 1,7-bisphosphate phosphatase
VTRARPAVFLDRDGTLIETDVRDGTPVARNDPASVVFLAGVVEACAALRDAGLVLVMATNQPEVARGSVHLADVEAVNQAVAAALGIASVRTCIHDDVDGCACRKPLPGLLTAAAADMGLALDRRSTMVGDRWKDVSAGRAAGVSTVLVARDYGEVRRVVPDLMVGSLVEAVEWIIARGTEGENAQPR